MRLTTLCFVLVALAACSREAPSPARRSVADIAPGHADTGGITVSLPTRIGEWSRPDSARRITGDSIFDYMDGAGELYLAYRFEHLDAFEYKAADDRLGTILVEIYTMKSSDDAFGLLSNDWGGEAPAFDRVPRDPARPSRAVPPHRALYGAGLLRIWKGQLYVRLLASRETPESREAVMRLGAELTRSEEPSEEPAVPSIVERLGAGRQSIRPDRTCYFRSHLVLNSQYFLASQDILGLGLDVDAATTEIPSREAGGRPVRVISVRYPTPDRASAALRSFAAAYLADVVPQGRPLPPAGSAKVEAGWIAWAVKAQSLVIALDAPAAGAARGVAADLMDAAAAPGTK